MLTENDLQWIMKESGETMVQNGNLDINLAASAIRQAAERLLVLLKYPDMRPEQEYYDLMMTSILW
ncbi:hypothetical protein LCGC14_2233820 [marine sediment metagenome]|uniref:Uncharacterized protein n=1 Tax=marine sediment metagenome TaxID=412755 RepID=A0A0F9G2I7_9ZZZZ